MNSKIAIVGGPKSGKTTFALGLVGPARSTDTVAHLGWSESSLEVSKWFGDDSIRVIEGVTVPRALRKWLSANKTGKPVNTIVVLAHDLTQLTAEQAAMKKGCFTVFHAILDELKSRGVEIKEPAPA